MCLELSNVHVFVQIQQSSSTAKYAGPIDCTKQLYREGGVRSVYKGTAATLMRGKCLSADFVLLYVSQTVAASLLRHVFLTATLT